ncbi:hypothetical protein B0H14DRAFT_2643343 [Mycena olivaceomarginata]|nr:hypothetical protein B0H14DRAFT_2643343 [Mycena olivaceomarginata]
MNDRRQILSSNPTGQRCREPVESTVGPGDSFIGEETKGKDGGLSFGGVWGVTVYVAVRFDATNVRRRSSEMHSVVHRRKVTYAVEERLELQVWSRTREQVIFGWIPDREQGCLDCVFISGQKTAREKQEKVQVWAGSESQLGNALTATPRVHSILVPNAPVAEPRSLFLAGASPLPVLFTNCI